MTKVLVLKGKWREQDVHNVEFDMVSPDIMQGKSSLYVTVDGKPLNANTKTVRIYIDSKADVNIKGQHNDVVSIVPTINLETQEEVPLDGDFGTETEEQAIKRLDERFEILSEMTHAAADSIIRGMIVGGAPGVGKSYLVTKALEERNIHKIIADVDRPYEMVHGMITPIGLYKTLYDNRHEGNVVVFDDSDAVFFDPISLSLLKAALDTTGKRFLTWKSESRALSDEAIPNSYDFEGSIIFITNMNLERTKSKTLQPHFDALISRSHYLDLTIHTRRDKYLRIKSLIHTKDMLWKYNFSEETKEEILAYMKENVDNLRELSLRTTLKIADMVKLKPTNWRHYCNLTVCR